MTPTLRYSLIYGILSGLVLGAFILVLGLYHERASFVASITFGYSVMLVAMSFTFVGVKRYRDVERGGVIGFWRAWGLGLLIALIGGLIYVVAWEAYLALTHYSFMDTYIAGAMAKARAGGMSPAKLAAMQVEMDAMRTMYANPLIRMPMTFSEIAPVGFLVSLVSAGLLCFPKFLPARETRPDPSPEGEGKS